MALPFNRNNEFINMYEDADRYFGDDLVSQNETLTRIINPESAPAKTAPASTAPAATAPAAPAPKNYDALTQQILGQGLTGKWTGVGHGSAEKNAADMARILSNAGITDIRQLGVKQEVIPAMYYEWGETPEQTVNKYYNKETGQELENTYSERQVGNFFGGTFEGKGNTGYGVQFGPDGTPYFYTQGASSNDLAAIMKDLGPVFQIGMAIATGGLTVPQQIAANMAVQVLSGQDVGDAIKNAAVSVAMSQIPGTDVMKDGVKYIQEMGLGETLTNTLTNSLQNAAVSGVKAIITGEDITDAIISGAAAGGINGAVNTLLNNVDGYKDLSAAQKRMVANSVSGVLSGKPLEQTLINSAIAAANAEIKDQLRYKPLSDEEYNELDPKQKEVYDAGGTKAYMQLVREQKAAAAEQEKKTDTQTVDVTSKIAPIEPVISPVELPTKSVTPVLPISTVDAGTVAVKSKADTCPIGTIYNPDTDSCDPVTTQIAGPTTPTVQPTVQPTELPKAGTVSVVSKADTCPIGTVYNPATDSCDPVVSQVIEPTTKVEPTIQPTVQPTELPTAGTVTVQSKADTCPIGTVYNPVTDSCDPVTTQVVQPTIVEPVIPTPAVPNAGTVTVKSKADTCPIGTVYNPDTDSCDPIATQTVEPTQPTPAVVSPVTPPEVKNAGTVTVQSKADTCPIGTVYNPDTDSCDPVVSQVSTPTVTTPTVIPTPTIPDVGTVTVKSKADTCPIGTVYNPDTNSCDPVGFTYTPTTISTPTIPTPTVPVTKTTDSGNVTVTSKKDTCPIGTVYNPDTDSCDPIASVTTGTKVTEYPTVTVVDKKDTCPIGTVYNPDTDTCDPITQVSQTTTQPVVQTPTKTEPTKTEPAKATPVKVTPTKAAAPTSSTPYPTETPAAPKWVTPELANVFYYGKDFGSKKQKINEEGELELPEYTSIGEPVYAAGGGVVNEQKNRENNVIDALDLIMGQSSNSMSLDDLLNIVKGS
jgi:hypothetical protein